MFITLIIIVLSVTTQSCLQAYINVEDIQKLPQKLDRSNHKEKREPESLRKSHGNADDYYNEDSVIFATNENRRDLSVAIDKSENENNVDYKSPENFRDVHELAGTIESEENMGREPIVPVERHLNSFESGDVKYESYEDFRNQSVMHHWIYKPDRLISSNNLEKRALPLFTVLTFVVKNVVRTGFATVLNTITKPFLSTGNRNPRV